MYSKDELKDLKKEFWESFAAYCEVQPYLRNRRKMWMLYNTKVKGTELKFDVSRERVSVVLEVNHRREEDRSAMFEKLTWYREALEKEFPGGLIWDAGYIRESGQPVCRIYTSREGIDWHRRQDWGEFFSFMAGNMYRLEKNYLAIADFIRE